MPTPAPYDILYHFKDIHTVVLNLADGLSDEQLNWRPQGYSTSIGFHLWHLARESDYLKAAIAHHYSRFLPDLGDGKEIWEKESLAQKWGFPKEAHKTVGTGLSDEVAAAFDHVDEELQKKIEGIRLNLLVFLTHDCRHLGMMECLRGLQTPHASIHPFAKRAGQTGFGSATEKR